ncbi:trichothecene 3-o-acetyltransferase [Pyrenophora seminiperda CCB06]|uniref:Trichothecene 3-o-acetyltransferase n=1 Tax=Pyrenophora seminiperda CCB06 TaxID=1302712 RepID=A0A3M7LVU0_9PLEO|nr:trichothecene 3-o-acetyltransferase [Pyrenophora seminiperda CCB06]
METTAESCTSNAGIATYSLSDLDLLMRNFMTPACLIYPLKDQDADTRSAVVEKLQLGLQKTSMQLPVLTGRVVHPAGQRPFVQVDNANDGIPLLVCGVANTSRELPSYDELNAVHFAPYCLPYNLVIPTELFSSADFSTESAEHNQNLPVCGFKVTFIEGGVVIGAAINHFVTGALGLDLVFSAWAASCRGFLTEIVFDPAPATSEPSESISDIQGLEEDLSRRGAAMETTLQDSTDSPSQSAKHTTALIGVSRSELLSLQSAAKVKYPHLGISTGDCFRAIMWQGITRAKRRLPQYQDANQSKFMQAITYCSSDHRPTKIPSNYLGNAAIFASLQPWTALELTDETKLMDVVAAIRSNIYQADEMLLKDVLRWTASLDDITQRSWGRVPFGKLDFGGTSWARVSAYKTADFGFGPPLAFRIPEVKIEWSVALPTRKYDNGTEFAEACVGLPDDVHEELFRDEKFRRYATVYQLPEEFF